MSPELVYQPIVALTAALEGKKLSAVELMQAIIARTKAVEPRVRAFNSSDEADALAQAVASDARRTAGQTRGPLDGIPIGLKDVIAVKDQPLTASSKILANLAVKLRLAPQSRQHPRTTGRMVPSLPAPWAD